MEFWSTGVLRIVTELYQQTFAPFFGSAPPPSHALLPILTVAALRRMKNATELTRKCINSLRPPFPLSN